ncbi:type VII secretion-associated serine protease mycosin [Micromonospora sp. NPDC049497]|uniref:type VII secretion-associated serine protease mycosin n=1 Tax=Micromonospora sp. NPDC049497 TaxID=3364273 RepID=UPI00379CB884
MPVTNAGPAPSPDGALRIRTDQWHLQYLKVFEAHKVSQGEGVTVAVLDTGVDPHPDLRVNLLPGVSLIPDEPGDGRSDSDSHGTGMAGIIAAHGGVGETGALGIAPKAQILPIKAFENDREGDNDRLARAIEYSISEGADVISISAGGGFSQRLSRALAAARSANVVVVAAAGNRPDDIDVIYPASSDGVIAVGGVDRGGRYASFSVTGPAVSIVAPAVDIYSTSSRGRYRKGTGTSDSTAIVAGAAALVRSKYPDLPASEVVHRLTATAVDKGPPGRDDQYGYGVIDLVAALSADVPPLGFNSSPSVPTAAQSSAAQPDTGSEDGESTVRGLLTLGVLLAVGGVWAAVARRRRHSDDPPPRISR